MLRFIFTTTVLLKALAHFPQAPLSLQQCIDLGIKNNESIRSASLGVDHSREYRKSATEIPKTALMYTQGQFNSIYKYDNIFNVTQVIPFPGVFAAQRSLAGSLIRSSELNYEATKAELVHKIKTEYYSVLYHEALYRLRQREDSIYAQFMQTVAARRSEGKATLLEKTSAEARLMEIQNRLLEEEGNVREHYIQLQTLLNRKEPFSIQKPAMLGSVDVQLDTSSIQSHPVLKFLKQQVTVNDMHVKLEKAKLMPDITLSYFNQSIYGPANIFGYDYFLTTQNRLQGFQVGLTLPLWFVPLRAKVKTVKIGSDVAEASYDFQTAVWLGELKQQVAQLTKYKKSVDFYKKNALTGSHLIIEEALRSYSKNEISYIEYMEIVQHALNTESNYLDVLQQYNMAALKIEFLLTK